MADIQTGGGASVGGDAQGCGNFAGRDYHQAEFGDNATGAAVMWLLRTFGIF